MKRCAIVLAFLVVLHHAAIGADRRHLASFIETLINKPQFRSANWGITVVELVRGEEIYAHDAEKLFLPASNRKVFTTALALEKLGSSFRYKTYLVRSGEVSAHGYLRGDLIVKASGDPTIGFPLDPAQRTDSVFRQWAEALKQKGINYVRGNIIIDCSAFDREGVMGPGWGWDYQPNNFAPTVSAFAYYENLVAISGKPTAEGQPCAIRTFPNVPTFTIINETKTVSSNAGYGLRITRQYGRNEFRAEGKMLTTGKEEEQLFTVVDAELVAGEVLKATLIEQGITIRGEVKVSYEPVAQKTPTPEETVAVYESPDLQRIIRHTNKMSDNFFAEQLYKTISCQAWGKGSYEETQKLEERFLSRIGVETGSLNLADGSGLSRLNLVSPNAIVQLLRYMHGSKESKAFIDSLPVSGKDGTLRGRLGDNGMLGRVSAKTGTMVRANCLSGCLRTRSGKTLVFSLMANNFACSHGEVSFAQDKILEALADL